MAEDIRQPAENTEESSKSDKQKQQPSDGWWTRLVDYVKRKRYERRTKKQAENSVDRAVRTTANATIAIAFFTLVSVGVSVWTTHILNKQLIDFENGSGDTHDLAQAAKTEAGKMSNVSDAADVIKQAAQNMVTQDQRIADDAEKSLDASNRQSKAALDASITASRNANALARESLDAQTRPWLGIEGNLTPVSSGWNDERTRRLATFSFKLMNYGQSPAMKMAEVFAFSNDVRTTATTEASACKEASDNSTASNPYAVFSLPTVFPGESGVTPITYPLETDSFPEILIGCIAYQGATDGKVHTTLVMYGIHQDKIKAQISEYIPRGTKTD